MKKILFSKIGTGVFLLAISTYIYSANKKDLNNLLDIAMSQANMPCKNDVQASGVEIIIPNINEDNLEGIENSVEVVLEAASNQNVSADTPVILVLDNSDSLNSDDSQQSSPEIIVLNPDQAAIVSEMVADLLQSNNDDLSVSEEVTVETITTSTDDSGNTTTVDEAQTVEPSNDDIAVSTSEVVAVTQDSSSDDPQSNSDSKQDASLDATSKQENISPDTNTTNSTTNSSNNSTAPASTSKLESLLIKLKHNKIFIAATSVAALVAALAGYHLIRIKHKGNKNKCMFLKFLHLV